MNNNILEIDLLDENGLPLYDENGEKYDESIIIPARKRSVGKPKIYEEGWKEHYKSIEWYKKYSREYGEKNIKIVIKCDLCGTMSNKLCLNKHKMTNKCKILRETYEVVL